MSEFQGIQGATLVASYNGPYTWGGPGPRVIADQSKPVPDGLFMVRDDFDGQWLWVSAGQMVPLTVEVGRAKTLKLIATRAQLIALKAQMQVAQDQIEAILKG